MTKKQEAKIRRLVRRALRAKSAAGKLHDTERESLRLARQAGFQVGQAVEVEVPDERDGSIQKTMFELVDNYQGDAAFRNVCVPHFELKKVPKFKRSGAALATPAEVAS